LLQVYLVVRGVQQRVQVQVEGQKRVLDESLAVKVLEQTEGFLARRLKTQTTAQVESLPREVDDILGQSLEVVKDEV
jgi:hypothetical protein